METDDIECEYLLDNRLCKAVAENEEGKALRDESCLNEVKNACCYQCSYRNLCDISCNYLSQTKVNKHARTFESASMELEKGEKVVLDDGALGFRKKLTLTNRRLLVQEGKGLLSVTWKVAEEIPIKVISEAYADVGSFTALSTLVLKLKNGATKEFKLKLSDSQMLGASLSADTGTNIAMRAKIITDRWVTAINHLIK